MSHCVEAGRGISRFRCRPSRRLNGRPLPYFKRAIMLAALASYFRVPAAVANSTASMGPWLLSHGDLLSPKLWRSKRKLLQWGHGFSAMETRRVRKSEAREGGFNGAMASQPWRPLGPWLNGKKENWLQWGHGFSAMETRRSKQASFIRSPLQWGHGFSAMETSGCL